MTDKTIPTDTELDALFAGEMRDAPLPSADLLGRIMADADMIDATRNASPVPVRRGLFGRLMATLGGWPAVAGLATATVVGIWIGYAAPEALNGLTDGYLGSGTYEIGDLIPAFEYVGQEG